MESSGTLPAMVVSHERSGTHFLINALAAEFDFEVNPRVDVDPTVQKIMFFHGPAFANFFTRTRELHPKSLRKSHHPFEFFSEVLDQITGDIDIFYIYRDPLDVMHSLRHYLNSWQWFEGPKLASSSEIIRAEPAGHMLRYQYHQMPDMLERWRAHVEGWLDGASDNPKVTFVRYEDLQDRYDEVLDSIAGKFGWQRANGERPERDVGTVLESKSGSPSNTYTDADLDYFRERIGPTMRRLGYEI